MHGISDEKQQRKRKRCHGDRSTGARKMANAGVTFPRDGQTSGAHAHTRVMHAHTRHIHARARREGCATYISHARYSCAHAARGLGRYYDQPRVVHWPTCSERISRYRVLSFFPSFSSSPRPAGTIYDQVLLPPALARHYGRNRFGFDFGLYFIIINSFVFLVIPRNAHDTALTARVVSARVYLRSRHVYHRPRPCSPPPVRCISVYTSTVRV